MDYIIGCVTRPFGKSTFVDIVQRISAAGFTDIALSGNVGITHDASNRFVEDIRKRCDDEGIKPSMLFVPADFRTGDPAARYRRMIDHAITLGSKWILDLGAGNREDFDRYVELMGDMAAYAQSAGICISAKPHGGITLTVEDLMSLNTSINHPAFGISYDPGNIIYYTKGEMRPETDIDRIAPIVTTGIIKDCLLRNGEPDVMITPGEGLVDFKAVFEGLVNGGFTGPLYLECVRGAKPDAIEENARNTRVMIEGLLSEINRQ